MPLVKSQKKSTPVFYKVASGNIDREAGMISSIVILQEGKDKASCLWDTTALGQIVTLGNAQAQGVKSRFGHPNLCDSAMGSYIGRFKNFRVDMLPESSMGDAKGQLMAVYADLYLDNTAKALPGKGNVYKYILDMAESNSDMFGNSIHYLPDKPANKNETDSTGAEVIVRYERVKSLIASDLVDSPCATNSLFNDTTDLATRVTEFLEDNPEVFDVVSKDESIINSFLSKYKAFKEAQKTMTKEKSTLDKIKDILGMSGKTKSFDAKTAEGMNVTVSDENGDGAAAVGDTCTNTDTGDPCVSMTMTLPDGSTCVCDENGVITSITPKKETPVETPVTKALNAELIKLKSENEDLKKNLSEAVASLESVTKELPTVLGEVTKLKSQLSALTGGTPPKEGQQNFRSTETTPVVNRVKMSLETEKKK